MGEVQTGERSENHNSDADRFTITEKGRAYLIAQDLEDMGIHPSVAATLWRAVEVFDR